MKLQTSAGSVRITRINTLIQQEDISKIPILHEALTAINDQWWKSLLKKFRNWTRENEAGDDFYKALFNMISRAYIDLTKQQLEEFQAPVFQFKDVWSNNLSKDDPAMKRRDKKGVKQHANP